MDKGIKDTNKKKLCYSEWGYSGFIYYPLKTVGGRNRAAFC